MAKKVFNKRIHRKNRVSARKKLKEVSKKSIHEKVAKMLKSEKKQ